MTKAQIKKWKLKELKKCMMDASYFITKYCKIQHPQKGRIPFDLYEFQEDCISDFEQHRLNIILKSRQLGISTVSAGYSLWKCMFTEDFNILVIATKSTVASALVKKVKIMYNDLPEWMKDKKMKTLRIEDNVQSQGFINGSKITAESCTEESGRSSSNSLLIIDEGAFIKNNLIESLWTAAWPTLSTGGRTIVLSCVVGNTFIFTDDGIKQIKDFVPNDGIGGDYNITDYNVLGMNKTRNGNLFHNNGKVKTKKIITKYSELEGSYNHKLWACKGGKYDWYKLEQLNVGDWVNVQYGMNLWGNNDDISDFKPIYSNKHKHIFNPQTLTPDMLYLMGLYISEGSSYKTINDKGLVTGFALTITCGDDITPIFNKLNINYFTSDNMHYAISSHTLMQFMEYLGFDLSLKANDKQIPSRILEMGKDNISALLSGIFDSNGYISSRHQVGINLNSETLIQQIRQLLLNFGMTSKYYVVSKESVSGYNDKHKHFDSGFNCDNFRLELSKYNSQSFKQLIGFRFYRKQQLLENVNHTKLNHTKNVVPYSLELVNDLFDNSNETTWSLRQNHKLRIESVVNKTKTHHTKHITHDTINRLYEIVKDDLSIQEKEKIDKILIPNSEWVQIKEIKESENLTYDFSLPETDDFWSHSILYNGILGHQTPNGKQGWFHKMWVQSENKENKFNTIKLHWTVHPDRDQAWRDEQTAVLGVDKASQECDTSFLSSGITVIEPSILNHYRKNTIEPIEMRGQMKDYWVWKYPQQGIDYIVVADVGRGDSADFSACHVIDVVNVEQVAEYKGKIGTKEYGRFLVAIATEYNNALLVVENATIGWAVLQEIIDLQYQNLFYTVKDLQIADIETFTKKGLDLKNKEDMTPGFTTSLKTRPLIIERMQAYLMEKTPIINSKRLISEFEVFVWLRNKAQAQSGYNDDLVMAFAIAIWIRETTLKLRQAGLDLTRVMMNSSFNKDNATVYSTKNIIHDSYTMNNRQTHGDMDISWLI